MSTTLQPPPFQAAISTSSGMLSPTWANWFRDAFVRVGAEAELSNTELATTQSTQGSSITSLNSTVNGQGTSLSSLQSDVNTLQAEIQGLAVGRQL